MKTTDEQTNPVKAWVVFSGKTDMRWLRMFRKGFRHCYVIINDGVHWTSVDPMSSYMDVTVHNLPASFDLPRWLEERGLKVAPASMSQPQVQAPWMVFTCVEAVKRVLGIHKRWILTPWQLYSHLTNNLIQTPDVKGESAWAV